jgi:hypothetical protein
MAPLAGDVLRPAPELPPDDDAAADARPRRVSRSAASGCPLRQIVFEFLSLPVRRESEPGVPMPTTSQSGTSAARSLTTAATRPRIQS